MLDFLGHLARWIVRRAIRLYYPKIEVTGREHIPASGAVLLVANHANSLIDPVIVGMAARRPVRFFAKAPLFDTPVLGPIMRALGMLPAFRAQDDSSQVRRNLESLSVAAQALARGDAVGIFPEGKSHDSLKLEQIRSGAARMAAQAVQGGARELKLVPVGINYQRTQLFRSAIWVRVGRPITVARFVAERGDDRAAIRALTEEIESRIKHVVIHLNDAVFEPFLDELELLLPPARVRGHVSISSLRQRKRLADAINYFHERDVPGETNLPLSSTGRDFPASLRALRPRTGAAAFQPPNLGGWKTAPPSSWKGRMDSAGGATGSASATDLAEAIREYRSHLMAAGLTSRLPVMRFRTWKLFFVLAMEALWLTFWFPAAIIGAVFHIVPFVIVRTLARKLQEGPTTIALMRLGIGLPLYALWYAGAWWALRSYFLPWVAWTVVSLMPLAGVFALTYARRARDVCRNWVQQVRVLIRPAQLREVREEQQQLRVKLDAFVDEYARAFPSLDEKPEVISWRRRARATLRWAAIVVVAAGIFVWQNWWFKESSQRERMPGLNLSGMSTNAINASLTADETALRDIISGVAELEKRTGEMQAEFAVGKRDWYHQADNDAVRQLLLAYVNYRAALLRIIWKYQRCDEVKDDALRSRGFLASFTATAALYDASLKFVTRFERSPNAMRKLNEAEPLWNIPSDLYDTVRRNLADPENRKLLTRAQHEYAHRRGDFERHDLLTRGPYDSFHTAIASANPSLQSASLAAIKAGVATPLSDARDTGKEAIYRAQTFLSSWVGDTKVREPRQGKPLIQPAQVSELRAKLKPGDVLLERRNWFLSNAFLPGYWPHSALYVGTPADVQRLGLARDPRVEKHWRQFVQRDEKGHEHVIIEAVSEGVVFTSLEHSVGEADAAAFLRPRLPEERIKEAIARAFSHAGKPYDFEFDFFSTDKLVCTELVFRSYDGDISFPLVEVMGRKTLPAIEIVRKCSFEHGKPDAQFDFVAFLDGDESKGRAEFADEPAFLGTTKRPALSWLQPRR